MSAVVGGPLGTALLEAAGLAVDVPGAGLLERLRRPVPRILDDVALSIGGRETVGLVGESGSGKTTLARSLVGMVRKAAGSIRFEGREVGAAAEWRALRRETAILFQDPVGSLSPRLTVGYLITEPFIIHGRRLEDRAAKAEALLDLVGLPPAIARRYPHELSGGQARRVGVARALALAPKLVVADEPTAGLDMSVQGGVLNLMDDMRERLGLSYLIVTHNLATIRHAADRLVILYLGRVVEEGPSAEVFARPFHPYTISLIAAEPVPDPRRRASGPPPVTADAPSLLRRPAGCEFHTRCPAAAARCRSEAPPFAVIDGDRRVRCHFPRM